MTMTAVVMITYTGVSYTGNILATHGGGSEYLCGDSLILTSTVLTFVISQIELILDIYGMCLEGRELSQTL